MFPIPDLFLFVIDEHVSVGGEQDIKNSVGRTQSVTVDDCDGSGFGGEGGGTSDPTIPLNPEQAGTKLVEACRADSELLCLSPGEFQEIVDLAQGSVSDPSRTVSGGIQALVDLEYQQWATKLNSSRTQGISDT